MLIKTTGGGKVVFGGSGGAHNLRNSLSISEFSLCVVFSMLAYVEAGRSVLFYWRITLTLLMLRHEALFWSIGE